MLSVNCITRPRNPGSDVIRTKTKIKLNQILWLNKRFILGMQNREVLDEIAKGYRMPKPTAVKCPDPYYDTMLTCWHRRDDSRPTFDFLRDYFTDYVVSSEEGYEHVE